MKEFLKKALITFGTVCMLCMAATACGTDPGSGNAAEDPADSTQTPGTGTDSMEASNADTPNAQITDTGNASSGLDQNNAGDRPEGSGRWHVLDPETASLVDADFEGTVEKIDSDSFYISEAVTEILDDGTMLMGTAASTDAAIPDSDLLRVVYDDTTRFYIRMIYNGGESYDDSEASSDDLELQASVSLKGEIRDDIFYADEIRISKIG